MPQYTVEEYASLLNRTYIPRVSRESRPRTVTDVTDKGEEILEFILPHPTEGRFSVSLQAGTFKGYVSTCTLRFGQVEVAAKLDPEEALSAVDEIIEDRIVAVVRYKNQAAYENHRKSDAYPAEWLYQMPDHERALEDMLAKLNQPVTFWDKIGGQYTGVFEIYRWSRQHVIVRL